MEPHHYKAPTSQLEREIHQFQSSAPYCLCKLASHFHALAQTFHDELLLERCVAFVVASRLTESIIPANDLEPTLFHELQKPHVSAKLRADLEAILGRDHACEGTLSAVLHFKGFQALQAYRVAHELYPIPSMRQLSLWIQSRASMVFGVDIHPMARIGAGLLLDHGTGVVIGSTAEVGDNCTIFHGATLGATGSEKPGSRRHPKIGDRVMVGANAAILGNITVGSDAKVGSGSVVVKPVPNGATAVGIPSKIFLKQSPAQSIRARL